MRNEFTQFKAHLQFFSPEEQILEINRLIADFPKDIILISMLKINITEYNNSKN